MRRGPSGRYSRRRVASREIVQKQSLQPLEYALHSGCIEGATRLAAAGLKPAVIQLEGSWRSRTFMEYVWANLEDSGVVSRALSADVIAWVFNPGKKPNGEMATIGF